jgi:hypothetical protein
LLGPVALPKDVAVLFFRQWTIRPLALIDPNARSGALVPCPLISIHGVDVPIRALLEKHYRSAFGPEDIANLAAAFEAALSKLGLVDRKDPVTMTVAKLIIEVRQRGARSQDKRRSREAAYRHVTARPIEYPVPRTP